MNWADACKLSEPDIGTNQWLLHKNVLDQTAHSAAVKAGASSRLLLGQMFKGQGDSTTTRDRAGNTGAHTSGEAMETLGISGLPVERRGVRTVFIHTQG